MSFNRLFYCKILFSMNTIIIIYTGGITLNLVVYLAGEIHTDWRVEIEEKVKEKGLPITFVAPQTEHDRSDDIGAAILGEEPGEYYKEDRKSTRLNSSHVSISYAVFCLKKKITNNS